MMSHTLDYPLALAHVQLGGPPRFDTLHGLPIGVDPPRVAPFPPTSSPLAHLACAPLHQVLRAARHRCLDVLPHTLPPRFCGRPVTACCFDMMDDDGDADDCGGGGGGEGDGVAEQAGLVPGGVAEASPGTDMSLVRAG